MALAKTHEVKCHSTHFKPLDEGVKTSEVRYNDRQYRVGDKMLIHEITPTGRYTGRHAVREITHILDNFVGLADGYVCLSLKAIE